MTIYNFKDKATEDIGQSINSQITRARLPKELHRIAIIKLQLLDKSKSLESLRTINSNRLEALKGNRQGQFSIRINDQYRICFEWKGEYAYNVEIVDYHK